MKVASLLLFFFLLLCPPASLAQGFDPDMYAAWNLPPGTQQILFELGYLQRYDLFLGLNPFYVVGDFDGDAALDVAIQVSEKETGKRGILIVHRGDRSVYGLGAGTESGNGGDDFHWLWVWHSKESAVLTEEPVRGSHVLYVEKPESAGGLLWWDGTRYRWKQWGD